MMKRSLLPFTKTMILLTSVNLYAMEEKIEDLTPESAFRSFNLFGGDSQSRFSFMTLPECSRPPYVCSDLSHLLSDSDNPLFRSPRFDKLMTAIEENDPNEVQTLLQVQGFLEYHLTRGLLKAIDLKNFDIINILLNKINHLTEVNPASFLHYVIKTENEEIITLFLNYMQKNCNLAKTALEFPFYYAVCANNLSLAQFILDTAKRNFLSSECMGGCFDKAATNKSTEMINFLLKLPATIRPSHRDIQYAFMTALAKNDQDVLNFLLNLQGILPLSKESVREIWKFAIQSSNRTVLTFLLNLPEGSPHLDQEVINITLNYVTVNPRADMVEFLLTLPEHIRPTQNSIDRAYREAMSMNKSQIVNSLRRFVSPEELQNQHQNPFPSLPQMPFSEDVIETLKTFVNQHQNLFLPGWQTKSPQNTRGSLKRNSCSLTYKIWPSPSPAPSPLSPEEQNRFSHNFPLRVHTRLSDIPTPPDPVRPLNIPSTRNGGHIRNALARNAFEIHDYSATLVERNNKNSNNKSGNPVSQNKPLMTAIFEELNSRIKGELVSFSKAIEIIQQAIHKYIPTDRQNEANKAVFSKLEGDLDYEQQLCLVITFLQQEHPESIGLWIHGFVEESITAYSAGDRTSCSRGIKERISTGLRNIDPELDKLFAQAEGSIYMKNFYIPSWNIYTNLASAVKLLIKEGLTLEHSASEAVNIFKGLFDKEVMSYGLCIDTFQADRESIADLILDGYSSIQEEIVKQMTNHL